MLRLVGHVLHGGRPGSAGENIANCKMQIAKVKLIAGPEPRNLNPPRVHLGANYRDTWRAVARLSREIRD